MPSTASPRPGQPAEDVHADSYRREGAHLVLRGTALVMNLPREIVVRRVPAHVRVEEVRGHAPA